MRFSRPKHSLLAAHIVLVLVAATAPAQPGSFDSSFANAGVFSISSPGDLRYFWDQVIKPDGKIVALQHGMVNGIYMNRLIQLNQDGTLDGTFSGDGILDFYWADSSFTTPRAFSVAIQNIAGTDRIVVAGFDSAPSGRRNQTVSVLRIDRFMPDGSVDTTFGTAGTYVDSSVTGALKLKVRPSDQALLTYSDKNQVDFIVCVNATGGLCSGFGNGGMFTVNGTGNGDRALALDSQERVLVGSTLSTGKGKTAVTGRYVTRYLRNGSVDTSFGSNGSRMVATADTARPFELTVDAYDNVVLAGTALVGGDWDLAVFRLTPSGAIDLGFNGTGVNTVDFAGFDDLVRGVAVDSQGRIVIAGMANYSDLIADNDFAVVRFNFNGSLDTTFGYSGSVSWDFEPADMLYAASVQNVAGVEKIVVAGGSHPHSIVARLLAD
jgi:uncharacterized delta-60 repeat protein